MGAHIDDMGMRRKLEVRIDKLIGSKNLVISGLATEAREKLKARDLKGADVLLTKAEEHHVPRESILDVLVKDGGMSTRTAARRAVENGKVLVDGAVVRKLDLEVVGTMRITVGERVVRGG